MKINRHLDLEAASAAARNALASDICEPSNFFLARMLGFKFSYPEDQCVVDFSVHDFMFNPRGNLHGGIIALAMDVSMGHLLTHLGRPAVTLELKTQFLRAVSRGRARAIGRILREGGSIYFMQSELFDQYGQVAAFASATWKCMRNVTDRDSETPALRVRP